MGRVDETAYTATSKMFSDYMEPLFIEARCADDVTNDHEEQFAGSNEDSLLHNKALQRDPGILAVLRESGITTNHLKSFSVIAPESPTKSVHRKNIWGRKETSAYRC